MHTKPSFTYIFFTIVYPLQGSRTNHVIGLGIRSLIYKDRIGYDVVKSLLIIETASQYSLPESGTSRKKLFE